MRTRNNRPNIFERLTNPRSYTGVYAERFRAGGKINAHADDCNIYDLSQITRPQLQRAATSMRIGKGIPGEHLTSGMIMDTPSTRISPNSPLSSPGMSKLRDDCQQTASPSTPPLKKSYSSPAKSNRYPSIFDRLADESSFTGVYAERFRSDGRINDHAPDDTIVHDLSQITRPNLNSPSFRASPLNVKHSDHGRPNLNNSSFCSSPQTKSRPNIFDRLNDKSSYTGVYAERFKSGGKINGAHLEDDGTVRDLSQITRTYLNDR